jgi:hypothetical protein
MEVSMISISVGSITVKAISPLLIETHLTG